MKRFIIIGFFFILSMTLMGCNDNQAEKVYTLPTPDNAPKQDDTFSEKEAITKAVTFHNKEAYSTYDFKETIKPNEIVSSEINIGGKQGNTTKLDMTITTEKKDTYYLITLTQDYNLTINNKEMISYWTYEVTKDSVKLIDKQEDGKLVEIIK